MNRKELFGLAEKAKGGVLPVNRGELAQQALDAATQYTQSHISQAFQAVAEGLTRNKPDQVAEWAERLAKHYITD